MTVETHSEMETWEVAKQFAASLKSGDRILFLPGLDMRSEAVGDLELSDINSGLCSEMH